MSKLIFRRRFVKEKDMQETVYINCSSISAAMPALLQLHYIGRTEIFPNRCYVPVIYAEKKTASSETPGRTKYSAADDWKHFLIFSYTECPCEVKTTTFSRIFPEGVIFRKTESLINCKLINRTGKTGYRYYMALVHNVNIELFFGLSKTMFFQDFDKTRIRKCIEEIYETVSDSKDHSAQELSVKLFDFLTLLCTNSAVSMNFTGPRANLLQTVAGYPQNYPTIASLRNLFHVSEKTLTGFFQKETGMSPMEFVIHYRLLNSCWQLVYTTDSIKEIAHLHGYSNEAFYSREFKIKFGISPSEYRKRKAPLST